mmetsp:Transcript_13118/g.28335  ORF Transcript_13118/g.28335 Transcript_13118/m.28335 type:complete len:240 (+) Transcript_13118:662-1381(+)
MIAMVPKEEPHAYEMACARTVMSVGSAHRGMPACSAPARKSAVRTSPTTSPSAHASSSTKHGSSTSFMPAIHASIASETLRMPWASTSASVTSQPAADAHTSALIESHSLSIDTSDSGTRLSAGIARTLDAPSSSMPAKVVTTMVPKGSSALMARSFVPGFGESGSFASSSGARVGGCGSPSAAPQVGPSADCVGDEVVPTEPRLAGAGGALTCAIGPASRPEKSKMGTRASSSTGKKR